MSYSYQFKILEQQQLTYRCFLAVKQQQHTFVWMKYPYHERETNQVQICITYSFF